MRGKQQPVLSTPSTGMQPQGQFAAPQAQSMPVGYSGPTSGGAV